VAYWISKPKRAQEQARACVSTNTHTHTHTQKFVTIIGFHGNNNFMNAPPCYLTRTLSLLLLTKNVKHSVTANSVAVKIFFKTILIKFLKSLAE
jgi:hypothetical protein